ncbi:MAG: hypothetical protein ACPGSB_06600 [Opitutales bacterium]
MFAITENQVREGFLQGGFITDRRRHYRGRNHYEADTSSWNQNATLPADPPFWDDMFRNSIRIGISAAKSSFKPAIWVWCMMVGLAMLYYLAPFSRSVFDAMVYVQEKLGIWFPSIGMGLCVGLLVECVRVVISDNKRWTRENSVNGIFNFTIWSIMGITQHYRYAWQVEVFGPGNSFGELATKVAFDQFIWTVFFANPYQAILYLWKNNNFSCLAVLRQASPFRTFWGTQMLPMLISNWAFWIPMAFMIYFFPPELQIPMAILAITIWVILLTYLTEASSQNEN